MNASLSFSTVLGEAIVVELSKSDSGKDIELELLNKKEVKQHDIDIKENLNNGEVIGENKNSNYNSNSGLSIKRENKENTHGDNNSDSKAKDFISLFFFFKYTGALISSLVKGHMIKYFSYSFIFLITGSISFLTVLSGILFIEEDDSKNSSKEISNKNASNNNNKFKVNDILSIDNSKKENELGVKYKKLTDETLDKQESLKSNFTPGINSSANFDKKKSSSDLNEDTKTADFSSNISNKSNDSCKTDIVNDFLDHKKIRIKDQIRLIFRFVLQKYILIPTSILIIYMSTPSYDDPIFYFFTEELKLNSVDLGLISTFSIIFTLVAIVIYKMKLKKYSFKAMIIGCSLVSFFVSFLSFILTKRYNLVIGIPDIFLILFSTSINSFLGELTLMPMLSLACLLSPKNLEGTAYAIFMSALNLGGGVSIISGSFLTQYMGITSTDFKGLPNMILISNITYLLPLPLIYLFGNSYFSPETKNDSKEKESSKSNEKFIDEVIDIQPIHSKNI